MADYIVLNVSLMASYIVARLISKTLEGKLLHQTLLALFVLSLTLPFAGKLTHIKYFAKAKISAQEVWSLDMAPPVLPVDESTVDLTPAARSGQQAIPQTINWEQIKDITIYLFLIGLVIAAMRALNRYRKLNQLLKDGITHKNYKNLRILIHPNISVGFSCWYKFKPTVVLPVEDLNSPWVLKHEIQHIRQKDHLIILAVELVTVLFYLNPAIYLIRRMLHQSMEYACDENVLERAPKARPYVETLVVIAERNIKNQTSLELCPGLLSLGGEKQSALARRINMIVNRKSLTKKQMALALLMVFAASTFALGAGSPTEKKVRTSLSEKKQNQVKEILMAGIKKAKSQRGLAIITNPQTGEVLYATGYNSKGEEMKKEFLSRPYPPYSIMKPIIAASALEKGLTTPSETHNCENGDFKIGDKVYRDWKGVAFQTTEEAIVKSGNICTIKIGHKFKINDLVNKMEDFGFGDGSVAHHYPNGAEGFIRKYREAKRQYQRADISSGHHAIYVTPLEVMSAYGAIANGGYLISPSLDGVAKEKRRVLKPEVSASMRSILRNVVLKGTGKRARTDKVAIGGKTASGPGWPYDNIVRASFIGMAPVESPRFLVYVFLENLGKGAYGGKDAAPIVRQILEKL